MFVGTYDQAGLAASARLSERVFLAVGGMATLAGAVLVWRWSQSGVWIDEFFSLYATDPDRSFRELWAQVLIVDNHPPLYNLAFWIVRQVGDLTIFGGRVLNLVAVAGLVVYWGSRWMAWPAQRMALAVFLMLALTSHHLHDQIGTFRGYALAYVALMLIPLALKGVLERPAGRADRTDLLALLAGVGLAANLHYFAALMAGLIVAGALVALHLQGRNVLAWRLGLVCAALAAPTVMFALVQADVLAMRSGGAFWIDHGLGEGVWILATGFARAIGVNIAAVGLALGAVALLAAHRLATFRNLARAAGPAAAVSAAAIAGFSLVLLAVSVHTPVIFPRYLGFMAGPSALAVAALSARMMQGRHWLLLPVAANAALFLFFGVISRDDLRQWDESGARIADVVRACPETPVYAVLTRRTTEEGFVHDGLPTNLVLAIGHRHVADRHGFPTTWVVAGDRAPIHPECGAVFWFEHLFEGPDPTEWFKARLGAPPPDTRLHVYHKQSSAVVIAEPFGAAGRPSPTFLNVPLTPDAT